MGYTSKNLSRSRRKALSAKVDTQDALHGAIAKIGEASRDIKSLNEKVVQDETTNRDLRIIKYYSDQRSAERKLKRADYDEFKSNYNTAIDSGNFDHPDNFLPEFDDWFVNRTKARIGGSLQSASDMKQGGFDVNNLNVLMRILELKNAKK